MKKLGLLILCLSLFFVGKLSAQNQSTSNNLSFSIPRLALLSIQSTMSAGLGTNPSSTMFISPNNHCEAWLNYSSIVGLNQNMRIMVNVSSGQLPDNQCVKLLVGPSLGQGGGNLGVATPELVLSGTPQEIVSSIGSCFTGVGIQNGRQLLYQWIGEDDGNEQDNMADAVLGITYTIVAAD